MVNAHERRFRSVRRAYYFLQGVAAEAGSRLSGNGEVPFAREFHNSELVFGSGGNGLGLFQVIAASGALQIIGRNDRG
jgi:hypothetical protein